MNRAQLRDRARHLAAIPHTTLLPDARLNDYLNEALAEINRSQDWPFLYAERTISAVVGQDTYPLPADARALRSVSVREGSRLRRRVLEPLSEVEFDALGGIDSTGIPAYYTVRGRDLVLYPAPNAPEQLTVRVHLTARELLIDTDEPAFRPEYHVAVAYMAASLALLRENDDSGRIDTFRERAATLVLDMVRDYRERRDETAIVLGGRRPAATRRSRRGY